MIDWQPPNRWARLAPSRRAAFLAEARSIAATLMVTALLILIAGGVLAAFARS